MSDANAEELRRLVARVNALEADAQRHRDVAVTLVRLVTVTLSTTPTTVYHNAGRMPRGWVVVRQSAAGSVYEPSENTATTTTLTLAASASMTITLLVL